MFLDDLLTTYQQMETSFIQNLYQFYKSFEFRLLWNVGSTLADYQRRASEAARGTDRLRGVLQLTNALQEIDSIESKGRKCFTKFKYSTNTHKWSFNIFDHAMVSIFVSVYDLLKKPAVIYVTKNMNNKCATP